MRQLVGRGEGVDIDIKRVDPVNVGEVIGKRIINSIGRDHILVPRRVVTELQPPHIAEQRIEDDLLHLRFGIHLLQGGVGYPL